MADTVKKYLDYDGLLYLLTFLARKSDITDLRAEIKDSKITVDDVFNANSTNPVQNKIVTAAHTTTQNSINNLSGTKADKASAIKSIALSNGTRTLTATMADGTEVTIGTIDVIGSPSELDGGGSIGQVLESHDRELYNKVDKVDGKALSTNDFTNDLKTKLSALPTNATLESTYAKKSDVTSAYKPKGSVVGRELQTPSYAEVGDVYNVQDGFTTDQNFVEGKGHVYPAGTNVVCVEEGGTKYWDVLGGYFDLSPYMKTEDITALTNTEIDTILAS